MSIFGSKRNLFVNKLNFYIKKQKWNTCVFTLLVFHFILDFKVYIKIQPLFLMNCRRGFWRGFWLYGRWLRLWQLKDLCRCRLFRCFGKNRNGKIFQRGYRDCPFQVLLSSFCVSEESLLI